VVARPVFRRRVVLVIPDRRICSACEQKSDNVLRPLAHRGDPVKNRRLHVQARNRRIDFGAEDEKEIGHIELAVDACEIERLIEDVCRVRSQRKGDCPLNLLSNPYESASAPASSFNEPSGLM